MDSIRRGNYDSGQDYVLEYGELRFTFNERDFAERVEQSARKLGFVGGRLDGTELEDLVNLTVNGEIQDPASALGEHVNDCWPELVGPAERSLVHWLRRLVFRSAWLDQRVKEGELDVVFDDATQSSRSAKACSIWKEQRSRGCPASLTTPNPARVFSASANSSTSISVAKTLCRQPM